MGRHLRPSTSHLLPGALEAQVQVCRLLSVHRLPHLFAGDWVPLGFPQPGHLPREDRFPQRPPAHLVTGCLTSAAPWAPSPLSGPAVGVRVG